MSVHFTDLTRQAALDGMIHDAEVLALRQSGWADGAIAREEAEAIFALQQATANPSPVWSDFFVEALRNFVLNGSEPRGYASDEEADWLVEQCKSAITFSGPLAPEPMGAMNMGFYFGLFAR